MNKDRKLIIAKLLKEIKEFDTWLSENLAEATEYYTEGILINKKHVIEYLKDHEINYLDSQLDEILEFIHDNHHTELIGIHLELNEVGSSVPVGEYEAYFDADTELTDIEQKIIREWINNNTYFYIKERSIFADGQIYAYQSFEYERWAAKIDPDDIQEFINELNVEHDKSDWIALKEKHGVGSSIMRLSKNRDIPRYTIKENNLC